MLDEFFYSVFSPKESFHIEDITIEKPTLKNFSVSIKSCRENIATLDSKKTR